MQNRIIFLRIFCENKLACEDAIFLDARRVFFADPEMDGGKVLRREYQAGERLLSVQYRFSGKKPIWTVRAGNRVLQKTVARKDGSYTVYTYTLWGEMIRSEEFSSADAWLGMTEYAQGGVTAKVQNGENGCLMMQQAIPEDFSVRNLCLVPCPTVDWENTEMMQAIADVCGVPAAVAFTQASAVCYYEERIAERIERIAQKMTAEVTYVAATVKNLPEPIVEEESEEKEPIEPLLDVEQLLSEELSFPMQSKTEKNEADVGVEEELPPMQELFEEAWAETPIEEANEEESEANEEESEADAKQCQRFEWEDRTLLLECAEDGSELFFGSVREAERSGFGAEIRPNFKEVFSGTWLYGGSSGIRSVHQEDGSVQVSFEDSLTQEEQTQTCRFSASGELLYAGSEEGGCRSGFGTAPVGKLCYIGQWKDNLPNGTGVLLDWNGVPQYAGEWKDGRRDGMGTEFEDGKPIYVGKWEADERCMDQSAAMQSGFYNSRYDNGKKNGYAAEYDETGAKIYEGSWKDGIRSGKGSLYLPDGGRIEGVFENGELIGTAEEYNAEEKLVYRGGFLHTERKGRGTLFENGEAVYEGEFLQGRFHGNGKQLKNGRTVYVGAFRDGLRHGVGAWFENGKARYFGQWKDGVREGCGVEYRDGFPRFAGEFINGVPDGRINAYSDGELRGEAIYKNGTPVYVLEYTSSGEAQYIGSVRGGERSGMGRLLGENCACKAQGIFSGGELVQEIPVTVEVLRELDCPEELKGSTYEVLARPERRCVVEVPFAGGRYSGHWKNGKPDGNGTHLFADHCYAGAFADGVPCGAGTLYLSDGETVSGVFGNGERIVCADTEYYVKRGQ